MEDHPVVKNKTKMVPMIDIEASLTQQSIADIMALPGGETEKEVEEQKLEFNQFVEFVKDRYEIAKKAKYMDEERWIKCYRNFRGLYGDDVKFTDTEKSQAFVKITKTKVLAAYAQITDILFSGTKFPIGVQPTPVVDGIAEAVYFDPEEEKAKKQTQVNDQEGAATSPRNSTVARQELRDLLGPYTQKLERVEEQLQEGYGETPTSYTFEPAKMAAKNMEKLIHDQLEESNASEHLRSMVFEMALYGTGAFKGPMAKTKEYPKWNEDGLYEPLKKDIADVTAVSIWDIYPDPQARSMSDAEFMIERHKMSRTQLRALKRRPYFRKEEIESAIAHGPDYQDRYWEQILEDNKTSNQHERFEVLEFWGTIDAEIAACAGLELPEDYDDADEVQVNGWICNGYILRLVLNPFTPARIPYFIIPYENNPYSIFGVGIAENMFDTQLLMNGFMRMAVDNGVLSGNVIFEIDETFLVPGQDMKIYPGKIFRRSAGSTGQAIHATKFDNVTQELLALFDKARQLADESTGMPSYAHGQGGVQGIGRTASGMSMLMGAAAQNIKAVVRNIDDFLLVPLGKALFSFNMQFNFDKKLLGDVEVIALGTESLMRNEIRSQKILQFLQTTANPMDAPFVKRDYLLRELSESLDLDADKTVNDPREAAIQAETIRQHREKMGIGPDEQSMGGGGGAPQGGGGGNPSDPTGTGGGNIAPGAAPTPGEQGFTGTPGGQGGPPQQ